MKNKLKQIDHDHIYNFVADHDIDQIIYIESQDPQFLAIQKLTEKIEMDKAGKLILIDLVVKISLISYQIGGTGELWRTEVCNYIYYEWSDLIANPKLINTHKRRQKLLQTCKYNRRLINMKIARLDKIGDLREIFSNLESYQDAYQDMNIFHKKICDRLGADIYAKTPLFAVKMFGYIGRIIFDQNTDNDKKDIKSNQIYPKSLSIPLDSRLKQIYILIHGDDKQIKGSPKYDNKIIIGYFDKIGNDHDISPLHLDSLIWLKYRDMISS